MTGDVDGFITRGRMYLYRQICPTIFASFPKSGKTWTKQVLESYFISLAESGEFDLDFDTWTPVIPLGKWRGIPGISFTHAVYRYRDDRQLRKFIRRCHNRRVIFQTRDPRRILLTYYFQRIRRFDEAKDMDFSTFIYDERFGIHRIVEYLNLWFASRQQFGDFLFLRYEDNVADAMAQFERILEFLNAPIDHDKLAAAIQIVPDTTRSIEDGGFSLLERLRHGDEESPISKGAWRGRNLPDIEDLLTSNDAAYVEEQLSRMDSAMGYSIPTPREESVC